MNFYEVQVQKTSKPVGSKEFYRVFDNETIEFKDMQGVKNWLKETYGKCKRVKMYTDLKDGNYKHIGWIYCFRNKDWSHNGERWLQQDWVNVNEVKKTRMMF